MGVGRMMTVFLKGLKIAGALLLVALLSALGGLIGAYLGGNFWVNFTLFGIRGYEAVGLLGFLLGLVGGLILIRHLIRKQAEKYNSGSFQLT